MTHEAQPAPAAPQAEGSTTQGQSLAGNLAQEAKDKALDLVDQQKIVAAEQVDDMARLVEDIAGEVEQGVPVVAPYLREAASSIHRVSTTLRERSADDLLQYLGAFARRQPAAVVGLSLVAGFALARFLKSSADRRTPAGHRSVHPQAPARWSPPSSRTSPPRGSGSRQPSEADLGEMRSPVAGMAALSDVTTAARNTPGGSPAPVGTSAAGGGAEAPEPSAVRSV